MPKLRAHAISISLDGYMAGPDQTLEDPLGVGAEALHEWMFETAYGREMIGADSGSVGIDDQLLREGFDGVGASIMGRNMFGPIRGEWGDEGMAWTGWWGPEPPYRHPVFVLTNHWREPLVLGETTFHFVTDGIRSAYDQAFAAADGLDVRLNGGASTIQQYLAAGLLDELHVAVVPVLLGGGERLFADPAATVGYEVVDQLSGDGATHVRIARTQGAG